jgi:hypothetical protein
MRALWYPKDLASPKDWEDAAAYDEESGLAVVADGASASFDGQRWARHLAWAFWDSPMTSFDDQSFKQWVDHARRTWHHHAAERKLLRTNLPEYLDPLDGEPASGATLLGVRLVLGDHLWESVAIGDACSFHVRGTNLLSVQPLDRPADFNAAPALIMTAPEGNDPMATLGRGWYEPGDTLYLATDAVAKWLLVQAQEPSVWRSLSRATQATFADLVEAERASGTMGIDDCTLLCCTWDGSMLMITEFSSRARAPETTIRSLRVVHQSQSRIEAILGDIRAGDASAIKRLRAGRPGPQQFVSQSHRISTRAWPRVGCRRRVVTITLISGRADDAMSNESGTCQAG